MIILKTSCVMLKKMPNYFPKFKDEMQWNDWYNKAKAQSRSQFVDEVCDVNYTPGSADYTKLFHLNERFMYIVLEKYTSH